MSMTDFSVTSTLGEVCLFEEISPRELVEMTALMRFSVIFTLFPIKIWLQLSLTVTLSVVEGD